MTLPDLINGLFEFGGGLFLMGNVKKLYQDKQLRGVMWQPTLFFTTWGYWNCFYYPHLNQWLSFTGGLVIVCVNSVWVYLALKYRNN